MKFSRLTLVSFCGLLAASTLTVGCGSISNLKAKYAQKKQQKALEKKARALEEEKSKPPVAQIIGIVSYVDEESGFILIKQLVGGKIPPSMPLISQGSGAATTAKLMSNPAAKGTFVVADIVSGQPQKGDSVLTDVSGVKVQAPPVMPIPAGQTAAEGGAPEGTAPSGSPRVPPKLDPILPPLEPLLPPSGAPENVPLPQ